MNADIDAHFEVDLLIAGAGPAGMTAALVASLEGLDVLLCETSNQVGGTGSTSAGTLWIPGNSQSRAAGFDDSTEQADRYLDALIGESTNRELRTAFLASGPKVIDYLSARTDVQFHWRNHGYPNFAAFLATLNHAKRKKIRHERRRVSDAGIGFKWPGGAEITDELWAFFNRCYRETYRQHHSTPYLSLEFFDEISSSGGTERLPFATSGRVGPRRSRADTSSA